jgi:hypothetical protein
MLYSRLLKQKPERAHQKSKLKEQILERDQKGKGGQGGGDEDRRGKGEVFSHFASDCDR